MQRGRLNRLITVSLLLALSVIFRRFLSFNTPIQSIGLGWLPILIAGLLYGPKWGFFAGALADFLGAILFPIGPYFAGFTLSAGLAGAIVPYLLRQKGLYSPVWKLIGALAVSQIITSIVLNTYWLTLITGKAAVVLLPVRVLNAGAMVALMAGLLIALRGGLARFLPKSID